MLSCPTCLDRMLNILIDKYFVEKTEIWYQKTTLIPTYNIEKPSWPRINIIRQFTKIGIPENKWENLITKWKTKIYHTFRILTILLIMFLSNSMVFCFVSVDKGVGGVDCVTCLYQYSIVAFFVSFRQLFIRWSKLCSWFLARPINRCLFGNSCGL